MSIFTYGATYNLNDLIPQDWRNWDNYWSRLNRYEVFGGYYHNIAYHSIVTYSQSLKVTERLYKHVRGVYNPVKRLCEGYVSKVYGGMLDTKTAQKGSIQLETENTALQEAITTLWLASQWGQKKSLYVRNGAMTGDSFIKIVDDIQRKEVRLEVVDPAKIKDIRKSDAGDIEYAELEYYIRGSNGRPVKYNETIDKEQFTIRIEGQSDYIIRNGRNEPITEWRNEYGFVPIVHVQHMDMGLGFGAPAIYGSMHKINELNDLASILNDGMRKQVQMPLIFKNAVVGSLDMGSDQSRETLQWDDKPRKDTVSALNIIGEGADVVPIAPTIDINSGLANIVNITGELEKDLPELALHRLRDSGQLTAPGVRSAYDDAIARYQEARGNYDTGLIEAHKLAVAIGGMRGYDGYQGFNLVSLENDSLDHQIATRPVISDTLALNEQINLTLQALSASAPKSLYLKMGWSEAEADEFVESGESSRSQFMLGVGQPQPGAETAPPDDPDATPEDMFRARQDTAVNETDLIKANGLLAVPA
jgi:hypothetical protein